MTRQEYWNAAHRQLYPPGSHVFRLQPEIFGGDVALHEFFHMFPGGQKYIPCHKTFATEVIAWDLVPFNISSKLSRLHRLNVSS